MGRRNKLLGIVTAGVLGAVLAWSVPAALRAGADDHGHVPFLAQGDDGAAVPAAARPEKADESGASTSTAPPIEALTEPNTLVTPPVVDGPTSVVSVTGPPSDADVAPPEPASDPLPEPKQPASPTTTPPSSSSTTSVPPVTTTAVPAAKPLDFSLRVIYALPRDRSVRSGAATALGLAVEGIQRAFSAQTGGRKLRVDRRDGAVAVDTLHLSRDDSAVAASAAGPRDQVTTDLAASTKASPHKLYLVFYDSSSPSCTGGTAPSGSHIALFSMSGCGAPGQAELAMASELLRALGPNPSESVFVDPPASSSRLPAGW